MAPFRDRSDSELNALTDEELVGQMHSARTHGDAEAELRAVSVLAYKLADSLEGRLKLRMRGQPRSAFEEVRDDIIDTILKIDQIEGESIGEVRSLANRVFSFRVADYFKKSRPPTSELADENADDDGPPGAVVSEADETGAVEIRMVVEKVLATRGTVHTRVIQLYLQGVPSKEIATRVDAEFEGEPGTPMSLANVDQIARRFRRDVEAELGGGA